MNPKMSQPYFLFALIAVSSVLVFFIFRPFLIALVLAAMFAAALYPLYQRIYRRMSGSPGLAAFITILVLIVCVLGPFTLITMQIVNDAQQAYASLSSGTGRTYLNTVFQYINDIATRYTPSLALPAASEFSISIEQWIKSGLQWLIQNLGGASGWITRFVGNLFVFLIALYYLLRDGATLRQLIMRMSPLADADDEIVFTRLKLAIHSIIRGSLIIALIQGILTGLGFAFFGVPNSVLWGVVAAFSALIPGIGTSLVLVPGIIYLFVTGAMIPAIGLLVWSGIAVGLIDNFLGPRLVGKGMRLHPLMVLLSVFGGLAFFGPVGVFLGPLCISLLFALLSIYQHISRQK